jgi:sigma-E factor negative regulatory protein RseC
MATQQARVLRADDRQVILEIIEQSGCHGCNLSAACGTAALGRLIGFRGPEVRLDNSLHLVAGDRVVLTIPDRALLFASLLIYLLPLIGLLGSALIAQLIGLGDGTVALSGVAGLGVALWVSSRVARFSYRKSLQPSMARQLC